MRQNSAYIAQEVALLNNLTALETLSFSADLKLNSKIAAEMKNAIVCAPKHFFINMTKFDNSLFRLMI